MNANEIAKNILESDLDSTGMNVVIEAIKTAQRIQRTKRSAIAITKAKVGATGTLTGLRPMSLNGTKVTVKGIKKTRLSVQEIGKTGFNSQYTVPAQCVIFD